jgi:hypothetical protein
MRGYLPVEKQTIWEKIVSKLAIFVYFITTPMKWKKGFKQENQDKIVDWFVDKLLP